MRFLFLFLLLACTKEVPKGIRVEAPREPIPERLETSGLYDPRIDVMVAFLWPEVVNTDSQRRGLREIIASSREMRKLQEGYFKEKLLQGRAWKKNNCDCVLNGLCEGEVPETPFEACEEIEARVFENERKLPAIYEIVEKMKVLVPETGGEWLKTHTDFPEGPASSMDFTRSELNLSVFAPEGEPEAYPPVRYQFLQKPGYESFSARFPDLRRRGDWEIDAALQRTPEGLRFQGKLFLVTPETRREGIIFWMNPVVL